MWLLMNCKTCDSKDQIEIAGKTFCANCGAVNSFVDKSVDPNQQNSQIQPSFQIQPTQQATPHNASASVSSTNSPNIPDQARVNPEPLNIPNQQNTPLQNTPPAQPINPYQQQNASAPNPVYQQQSVNSQMPAQPNPQVQANTVNYSQPAPTVTQIPQMNNSLAPTQMSAAQATQTQPQAIPQPQNVTNQQIDKNSSASPENIGNEIGQLSKKDNLVFSDDELDQLANEKPATSNVVNPFADITSDYNSAPPKTRPIDNISINNTTKAQIPPNTSSPAKTQDSIAQPVIPKITQQPTPQSVANALPPSNSSHASNTQDNVQADIITAQVEKPKKDSKLKKHASKAASVGLSLAGVILLGVYVWQINYPNLALKVAGSKAGISASLPSYLPNGWRISGDIQANPGSISYKLATAEGDKSVAINQVRSDWDSQALAENYLAPNADKYTALQAEGLTIYIYNNNQASWVNHGTWYRIEGQDHGLSKDQIIKMATSL